MIRIGLMIGLGIALVSAVGAGAIWLRKDAVRDFMRDAAIAAAEKRQADQSTKDRIATEIGNATIDELRERAVNGGMFTD